jgi:hypothetical protein
MLRSESPEIRSDEMDDIILEMARLEREALARARQRQAEQQLGEAFFDLVAPAHPEQRRAA